MNVNINKNMNKNTNKNKHMNMNMSMNMNMNKNNYDTLQTLLRSQRWAWLRCRRLVGTVASRTPRRTMCIVDTVNGAGARPVSRRGTVKLGVP